MPTILPTILPQATTPRPPRQGCPSSRTSTRTAGRALCGAVAFAVALLGVTPVASATNDAGGGATAEGGTAALSLSTRSTEPAATDTTDTDAADPAPTGEATEQATGQTVADALAEGELATARTLAVEQRRAAPTAANWGVEAEAFEASGDNAAALAAYRGQLDALPQDADAERSAVQDNIARVLAASRGTVVDEPDSTHREALDARWAPPSKGPAKKKTVAPAPTPSELPDDRVVNKWYFWVTLGAIAASAAAVTAIAIRASRQEQPDALGLSRAPTRGPTMLRF